MREQQKKPLIIPPSKKMWRKATALVCGIVLLLQMAPVSAIAQELTEAKYLELNLVADEYTSDFSSEKDKEAFVAPLLDEDVTLREPSVKHFRLQDGTYIAATYAEPVHYLNDGIWVDIDNRIFEAGNNPDDIVLRNTDNPFGVEFATKSDSSKLVSLTSGEYKISWSLVSNEVSPLLTANADVSNFDTRSLDALDEVERVLSVTKNTSKVSYSNITDGVELRYTLSSYKLKEEIILDKVPDVESFVFDISTGTLSARLNDDKTIDFYNPKNPDTVIFTITAPFMYDSSASQAVSDDINISLERTDDGYILTLTPSQRWLLDEGRVYPVIIDPTVYDVQSSLDMYLILDTFVYPGADSGNASWRVNYPWLIVGNDYSLGGVPSRALIQFPLPTIAYGAYITNATVYLTLASGTSTWGNIDIYRIGTPWTSTTITWDQYYNNVRPNSYLHASNVSPYYDSSAGRYRYAANITGVVAEWYGGYNYGLEVRYTNEGLYDYNWIYSAENGEMWLRPYFLVSYSSMDNYIEPGEYLIKSVNSGKYLTVSGGSNASGTPVVQYGFNGTSAQRWTLTNVGAGSSYLYNLKPACAPSMSLDWGPNNIAQTYSSVNSLWEQWSFQMYSVGIYTIVSAADIGMALDVAYASTADGASVILSSSHGGTNQQWILEPVTSLSANTTKSGEYLYLNGANWYSFMPSVSGTYAIYSLGTKDTYGELYQNGSSSLLKQDDDSGGGSNFLMEQNLTAGTIYYLKVRGYSNSVFGYYSVGTRLLNSWTERLTNSNASINSGFNRTLARQYMELYSGATGTGTSYNPNYQDYSGNNDGGDCTNYASQCLHESGLGFVGAPTSYLEALLYENDTAHWFYTPQHSGPLTNGIPLTWINVGAFREFWGKKSSGVIGNCYQYIKYNSPSVCLTDIAYLASVLKPGDILQISGSTNHTMIVSAIVTDETNQDILLSGHSTNRLDASLKSLILNDPKYSGCQIIMLRIEQN